MLTAYIILIIAIALVFDFSNGFNDAANSVATIVATKVLSPRLAVVWAAFFNFVAAFFFETHVATTIAKDLVRPGFVDPHLVMATLIAAILWTIWCTQKGLPISVSHALMGSMAGAAIAKGGVAALFWSKIGYVAIFIVLSPLIGFAIAWALSIIVFWSCRKQRPRAVDGIFRVLQLLSAAIYSLSHGLNDAQKTMGIITTLLLSQPALAHLATHSGDPTSNRLAWWIILSCHGAIALGTYFGGWKVIHTLGNKVTKLQPWGGFSAETSGGVTIIALSAYGIPVSTTHTITGAIFGVGITRRWSAVRWSVGTEIVTAWVLTLPAAGLMAAMIYSIMRLFF